MTLSQKTGGRIEWSSVLVAFVIACCYALIDQTWLSILESALIVVMVVHTPIAMVALLSRFALLWWLPDTTTTNLVCFTMFVWLGWRRQPRSYVFLALVGIAVLVVRYPHVSKTVAYVSFDTLLLQLGVFAGSIWRLRGLHRDQLAVLRGREHHIRRGERRRLARDLHDIIAHQLSAVALHSMSYQGSQDPDELHRGLGLIADSNRRAREELEKLNVLLKGDVHLDEETALSIDELEAIRLRLKDSGLRVEWIVTGDPHHIQGSFAASTRRILQELTTNIIKYADRHQLVSVHLRFSPLELVISASNGVTSRGFRLGHLSNGWGLTGIRERVELHGGTTTLASDPQKWSAEITLPLGCHTSVQALT